MALLRDVWSQFLKYFWPSNLFMGFGFVIAEWHRGDVKNRALLLLLFTPMLVCALGLVFSFASFVFAFISKLLGWFLLTAFFGGGGIFCYEKLRESRFASSAQSPFSHRAASSTYDATAQSAPNAAENAKAQSETGSNQNDKRRKWFGGTRG
ncbi:MAG: hypothetical protein LBQ42_10835 [Synergistaceae bacterium]|jgi:hypothetical protein|nr:hypothetical protein [Synergistaceae bacterium]